MTYRSKAFRDLCQGRACVFCNTQDETVVPAHRNRGKGMALKVTDAWVVPACMYCHNLFDRGNISDEDWLKKFAVYVDELLVEGRLTITGHQPPRDPKYKPLPKILPRAA